MTRCRTLALLAFTALPLAAVAHGYVDAPKSRAYLCKTGGNTGCGAVQWEPQSLEGPSGWPAGGPPDGHIASAGNASFYELDVQTPSRWAKNKAAAGKKTFKWTFTAAHVTRDWRYYISRPDWNPGQPLTRASFETQPFCTVDGGMQQPPMTVKHKCTLPARSGYQVVLAVWEIGDTANSFYNVIDLSFR